MAHKPHPQPEINVTPLVDVVLVLLIIFMVVTPALANEDRVLLPEADHPDAKKEEPKPWEVVLDRDGRFVLDERPLDRAALRAELLRRKTEDPTRRVLLLADGRLPYGAVRDAFVALQGVGFRGVSLKVLERPKKGA